MKITYKLAKSQFFDRNVTKGLSRAAKTVLSKYGAFVRRSAKSSLRMAKQKTRGEMTAEERDRYDVRVQIAKREGKKKPRRPDAISKPGDPPRLHTRPKSPLRELIFFVYDPNEKAVVIGPTASKETNGRATEALEFGKRGVKARPFMGPAAERERPNLLRWKNTVK